MAQTSVPIFLIGPRASGKSGAGRLLARFLRRGLYDVDDMIADKTGISIAEFVAQRGWRAFRELESRMLVEAARPGGVVATGGGVVLASENREFMRNAGLVLHLSAPAELLYDRLAKDPRPDRRPPLTDKDLRDEIRIVLAEREFLYSSAAHHRIDASPSINLVARAVLHILSKEGILA